MTLSRKEMCINFDRSNRLALLALLILWSSTASADEELINSYKSAIEADIFGDVHTDVGEQLLESGLAQIDIDRILEKLAADAASCITDAIIDIADANGIAIETVIVDPESASIETQSLDEGEFREIATPCLYTAFENAGISAPPDTN